MSQPAEWGVPTVAVAAPNEITPVAFAQRSDDSFDAFLVNHYGTARPVYMTSAGGTWADSDDDALYYFDGTNDLEILKASASGDVILSTGNFIVSNATTPASATANGTTGTIAWDADFIYVCTATDTWKRAALTTW